MPSFEILNKSLWIVGTMCLLISATMLIEATRTAFMLDQGDEVGRQIPAEAGDRPCAQNARYPHVDLLYSSRP